MYFFSILQDFLRVAEICEAAALAKSLSDINRLTVNVKFSSAYEEE